MKKKINLKEYSEYLREIRKNQPRAFSKEAHEQAKRHCKNKKI